MSEMFDKSQMSETIDIPAGCSHLCFRQTWVKVNKLTIIYLFKHLLRFTSGALKHAK